MRIEPGNFWISKVVEIKKYLKDQGKFNQVMDILGETESDIIIKGENKFLEAYRKLEEIGEGNLAKKLLKDFL